MISSIEGLRKIEGWVYVAVILYALTVALTVYCYSIHIDALGLEFVLEEEMPAHIFIFFLIHAFYAACVYTIREMMWRW